MLWWYSWGVIELVKKWRQKWLFDKSVNWLIMWALWTHLITTTFDHRVIIPQIYNVQRARHIYRTGESAQSKGRDAMNWEDWDCSQAEIGSCWTLFASVCDALQILHSEFRSRPDQRETPTEDRLIWSSIFNYVPRVVVKLSSCAENGWGDYQMRGAISYLERGLMRMVCGKAVGMNVEDVL